MDVTYRPIRHLHKSTSEGVPRPSHVRLKRMTTLALRTSDDVVPVDVAEWLGSGCLMRVLEKELQKVWRRICRSQAASKRFLSSMEGLISNKHQDQGCAAAGLDEHDQAELRQHIRMAYPEELRLRYIMVRWRTSNPEITDCWRRIRWGIEASVEIDPHRTFADPIIDSSSAAFELTFDSRRPRQRQRHHSGNERSPQEHLHSSSSRRSRTHRHGSCEPTPPGSSAATLSDVIVATWRHLEHSVSQIIREVQEAGISYSRGKF